MTGALEFNAELHEYRIPNGRLVPSVTQVLRATGVSVDFEQLRSMSDATRKAVDAKRDIGIALHSDAWAFDDDDLDWQTVDPRVEPYLRAWATFRANTGIIPLTRERRLFHPTYGYAGTLDGIFLATSGPLEGKRVLIDLKVGDPAHAAAHLQTAAYEAAYLAEHADESIDARWAVQLCPDRQIPYRITAYSPNPERPDAWRDLQKFLACLTVYHEQPDRRMVA